MKKMVFFLTFLIFSAAAMAQENYGAATHQFPIGGKIKNPSVINMDSLEHYSIVPIGDINVADHTGAFKHKDDQQKGVLLKDILNHSIIDANSPKLYSSFYYTCIGSDGYKVVYSWNELFNTDVGNHVYILMEKNGIKAAQMPESIQMALMMDQKTGRRFLHHLDKIVISQAE